MSGWASGWATGDLVTAAEFKKGVGCIYDTTLGVAAATIDITGIVATYAHLLLVIHARTDSATADVDGCTMRFNNDAGGNYDSQYDYSSATTLTAQETLAGSGMVGMLAVGGAAGASIFAVSHAWIPYYTNASFQKAVQMSTGAKWGVGSGNLRTGKSTGYWRGVAAINRITFIPSAGNFAIGTRITLYAMGA